MPDAPEPRRDAQRLRARNKTPLRILLGLVLLIVLAVVWVGVRGLLAKGHLEQAVSTVGTLRTQLTKGDTAGVQATARRLDAEASAAKSLTSDPVWGAFEHLPFVGPNLRAVRQVAVVVDEVSGGAVRPVAGVLGSVNLESFAPKDGKVDLEPLVKAQPAIAGATRALSNASRNAMKIDTSDTLSPVTDAVGQLRSATAAATAQADIANRAVQLAPALLGHDGDRQYLLLFQNNAELRAGGGIPGAVALLKVRDGHIELSNQASGSSFEETADPVLPLPTETQGLYGSITGRYMQDVTLTPRFDLSAELARRMWKNRFGDEVDGVLAMDPVTLSYLLQATGPVQLPSGESMSSDNAVKLLLSDVYAKYTNGDVQDAFFASAASAVFDRVSSGGFDPKAFIAALTRSASENRLRLWSAAPSEQDRLDGTAVAGELPASKPSGRQYGVYLNDATGAKMDFYLEKTVAIGSDVCRKDGRPTTVVAVTLKNTAPADAASSLPAYVTGAGNFGVAPGNVQTNVAVYGPPSDLPLGSSIDGKPGTSQSTTDGKNPVLQQQVLLAPGESRTIRVAFLGEAKYASSPVQAISTPGIVQNVVEPASFTCSAPTAG
jgi:hypothetical protein